MVMEVGMEAPAKARLLVRLIVKLAVEPGAAATGTVINTGDHAPALRFTQVAVTAVVGSPQMYPHIGTEFPSGRIRVLGPAVRLTDDWAEAMPAPRRRTDAPRTAVFRIAFRELSLISVLLT
jgi:hypothetical protein